MAATLEPPVAPPPSSAAQVGSAVPSSKGVIHVTQSGMSSTPPDLTKPALESKSAPIPARDQMQQRLATKIKPETRVEPKLEKPLEQVPKPEAEVAKEVPASEDELETAETATSETAKPGEAPVDKKKVNPWKLVDEHKAARAKTEAEVLELKKLIPNEAVRKQEVAELEAARKELKEYQDEIRYVNYAKSPEFKEKYQKPYEQAWAKAMSELKEITVEDVNGDQRAVTATDMLELVNAPLGKAREMAETMFGSSANDVMIHRKEIKNLFEAQASALEEARTKGAEREKSMQEQTRSQTEAIHRQIADHWEKAKSAALEDENIGRFLKPIEGNQDHNHRLVKATELVERALKESPLDPRLQPEERASIVKRHAALRNRAVAYGPLLHENKTLTARISELESKLKQYEASTPSTAGGQPANGSEAAPGSRDGMMQRLQKLAKPQ